MARAPAKHRRRCPGRAPNENQTNAVLLRLAVLIRHGYSKCVDPIGPSPALQLGLPHVAFGDSGHVESGDSALDLGICPCFCTGLILSLAMGPSREMVNIAHSGMVFETPKRA